MTYAAFKDATFKTYYIGRILELEDAFALDKKESGACWAATRLDAFLSNEHWIAQNGLIEAARREVLGVD